MRHTCPLGSRCSLVVCCHSYSGEGGVGVNMEGERKEGKRVMQRAELPIYTLRYTTLSSKCPFARTRIMLFYLSNIWQVTYLD